MILVIADSAWESLDQLALYWAQFNTDEKVQERTDALIAEAQWLCRWPGAGAQEVFIEHRGVQYRKWLLGKVKIIYYIRGNELRVSDFFEARQHPRKMKS